MQKEIEAEGKKEEDMFGYPKACPFPTRVSGWPSGDSWAEIPGNTLKCFEHNSAELSEELRTKIVLCQNLNDKIFRNLFLNHIL